jgi:predicted GIY-YIG superfamily endonuclease
MDLTDENVLYVMVCNGCKEFYIGHTGDILKKQKKTCS